MAVGSSQADRHRRAVGAAARPGNTNRPASRPVARGRVTSNAGGGHTGGTPPPPGIGSTAGGHVAAASSVNPGVAMWGAYGAKGGYNGPGTGLLDGMEPWHAAVLILAGVLAGIVLFPRR